MPCFIRRIVSDYLLKLHITYSFHVCNTDCMLLWKAGYSILWLFCINWNFSTSFKFWKVQILKLKFERNIHVHAFLFKPNARCWLWACTCLAWAQGYETFFMLNSAEREIFNTHKSEKYQEMQLFPGSDKPRMLHFLFINNRWHFNI